MVRRRTSWTSDREDWIAETKNIEKHCNRTSRQICHGLCFWRTCICFRSLGSLFPCAPIVRFKTPPWSNSESPIRFHTSKLKAKPRAQAKPRASLRRRTQRRTPRLPPPKAEPAPASAKALCRTRDCLPKNPAPEPRACLQTRNPEAGPGFGPPDSSAPNSAPASLCLANGKLTGSRYENLDLDKSSRFASEMRRARGLLGLEIAWGIDRSTVHNLPLHATNERLRQLSKLFQIIDFEVGFVR